MASRFPGLVRTGAARLAARPRSTPARVISRGIATPASATSFDVSTAESAKLKVATAQDSSPTAAITVVLKAGSRYETLPGVSHLLKNAVFKSTAKRSELRLVREAEILGGVLTSGLTREHLFLTAEFLRGDEGFFAELLGDAITLPRFLTHELSEEGIPQALAEAAQAKADPAVLSLDIAHQLAFRTGLGNSLFLQDPSQISYDQFLQFAQSSLANSSNVAVVASGIPSRSLTGLVDEFFSRDASSVVAPQLPASKQSEYFGGEVRVTATSHGGPTTGSLLVGFKGGAISDPAYSVLAHYLGGQPSVKWSKGSTPFSGLAVQGGAVRAFNVPYSDSGLVGFQVVAPTAQVGDLAKKAVEELKKVAGGVKEEDVKRAIAKAKFAVANTLESRTGKLELVGSQLLSNGSITSLDAAWANLDKVDASAVQKAAANALKSKPTTVAVGNTHELPYADTLGL